MALDLRQLRHFTAIVDNGGFARAAAYCHVSQPTISASIAQLESRLGTALLERGSFGARPTSTGRVLYDRAKLILHEVARAREEIACICEGVSGSVTIGIGPLFEHIIMPGVVADFLARRPTINVTATIGITVDLFGHLAKGELDLAISSPPGGIDVPDGIDVEVLEATRDVIIAASDHPIFRSGDYTLSSLAQWRWIVSARVNEVSQGFFSEFSTAGIKPPRTVMRTDSMPILRQLVREQQFLCVASRHLTEHSLQEFSEKPGYSIVPSLHFSTARQVCLSKRSGALLTKSAQEMEVLIRNACQRALSPIKVD